MSEPAFPVFPETGAGHAAAFKGMTLRDYFAAKAMQSILNDDPDYHQKYHFIDLADFSYRCADAMMKARKQ